MTPRLDPSTSTPAPSCAAGRTPPRPGAWGGKVRTTWSTGAWAKRARRFGPAHGPSALGSEGLRGPAGGYLTIDALDLHAGQAPTGPPHEEGEAEKDPDAHGVVAQEHHRRVPGYLRTGPPHRPDVNGPPHRGTRLIRYRTAMIATTASPFIPSSGRKAKGPKGGGM